MVKRRLARQASLKPTLDVKPGEKGGQDREETAKNSFCKDPPSAHPPSAKQREGKRRKKGREKRGGSNIENYDHLPGDARSTRKSMPVATTDVALTEGNRASAQME